jgi:hypothetical protein
MTEHAEAPAAAVTARGPSAAQASATDRPTAAGTDPPPDPPPPAAPAAAAGLIRHYSASRQQAATAPPPQQQQQDAAPVSQEQQGSDAAAAARHPGRVAAPPLSPRSRGGGVGERGATGERAFDVDNPEQVGTDRVAAFRCTSGPTCSHAHAALVHALVTRTHTAHAPPGRALCRCWRRAFSCWQRWRRSSCARLACQRGAAFQGRGRT